MNLWEVVEYVGETLVFIGVVGEVYAEWTEPHRKKLGKASSIVLVIGLGMSLAALIGTNEYFNDTIADLNNQAAQSNLDAGNARKDTEQLRKDEQALKTKADEAELELARLTGPVHIVHVIKGVATPDLSKGLIQQLLLTKDVRINPPILPPLGKEGTATWTLFLDQDSVGSHQYTFEFMRDVKAYPGLVPNSRASFDFVTDTHGRTTMRGIPIIDMPKTTTPSKK